MKTVLALAAATVAAVFALDATALAQRTFVSVTGSDANPCSVPLPCRTFDVAHAATSAGGEIVAVDSGGFGTVTITKSIQIIVPPGVHAAIFAASGTAVTISAGTSDVVVLRGLYVSSTGATNGILASSVGRLQLEGTTVQGFVDAVNMTSAGELTVLGCTFRNNSGWGIKALPTSGSVRVVVDRSTFVHNGFAMTVFGAQPFAAISNSVVSGHDVGFTLYPSALPQVGTMFIDGCTIVGNNTGIVATANSGASNVTLVYVSNSTIARNAEGVLELAGAGATAKVISRSNNTLEDNSAGNAFSTTYTAK